MRAREAYPDDGKTAKTLGIITYKRGDLRRSVDLLKESIRKGTDAEVLFYLGMAYWKLGDQQESGKALREALALDPNARFVAEAKEVLAKLQ